MAEKNLHDIKIDELGSSKKTPLRNILTLLALLFIILVISIFITRLILKTDDGSTFENNASTSEKLLTLNDGNKTADTKSETANTSTHEANNDSKKDDDKKETTAATAKAPTTSSNVIERNLTSAIKAPLTSHEPKVMRTYKEPKKNSTPKVAQHNEPKKTVVKHTTVKHTTVKHTTIKHTSTHPKKEYIDKVVATKHTTSSSKHVSTSNSKHTSTANSKHASYLGGHEKKVTNSFYIKVGTYRDVSSVLSKIKRNHFNYALVKVENDKTLTRVLVGPFFSRNQANGQLSKVKANILTGAYVTKVQ